MRRLVPTLLAFAVALVAIPSLARAAEVDDRVAKISRLEQERAKIDAQRAELEKQLAQKTQEIAKLKKQRSSWNRDQKLKKALAAARDVATALEKRAEAAAKLDQQLKAERKALIAAIDRELAAQPAPAEARRAKLVKLRADVQARVGGRRPVRAADEEIDPLDDPEDLDEKAQELADSEAELRAEEARLGKRAEHYRKQAKLQRSRRRADEIDVYDDDQPRRQGSRGGSTGTQGARGDEEPAPGAPAAENDDDAAGGFTGTPPSPDPGEAVDVGGDPAVVYADVVDPETVRDLERAERSGDPEAQARAAERAQRDIKKRADAIRKKRLEMEKRARELRDSE